MSEHAPVNFEAMYELEKSRRILADIDQHLAPREGETNEQWQVRHDAWLKQQTEVFTRPAAKPPTRADTPAFAAAFQPGQVTTDEAAFHRFLPPMPDESSQRYAARLANAGLALTMTSEQIHDDVGRYKEMMNSARQTKLPLFIATASLDTSTKAEDALYSDDARAKLLADARVAADRAAKTNTPRG